MPVLWINEERVEAKLGDSLLDTARQAGSHVWFVCDGRGLCLTCECQVLIGAGHLNPPGELEESAISASRRQAGYRLACQARLTGNGDVSIMSRAESLRRQAVGVLAPAEGATRLQSAGGLFRCSAEIAADMIGGLPHLARYGLRQVTEAPPTIGRIAGYARDSFRVMRRVFQGSRP
jgi:ferredoxin